MVSCSSKKSVVNTEIEERPAMVEIPQKISSKKPEIKYEGNRIPDSLPQRLPVVNKANYKYDEKTASELSRKFGLRLSFDDYIPLYEASGQWIGTRHRFGGSSKKGVDCSGFTSIIYNQVFGRKLERSSRDMLAKNCTPISREELKEGDLVFFRTSGRGAAGTPTHVGIYLKAGKFIHASVMNGVIVSSLSEPYYIRTWISGGRVLDK
jgi:lipoprotein Spr